MSPVEIFVGSLASCVAYFIGRYCARHNLAAEGLTVDVDWSMAERPHRVGEIRLQVHGLAVPAHHREQLLKVAHGCTVHQSLLHAPKITV
jgi:putative redox protein